MTESDPIPASPETPIDEIIGLCEGLHEKITGLREGLHREVVGLRDDLREEVVGLHEDVVDLSGGFEGLHEKIAGLREDVAGLREGLHGEIVGLREGVAGLHEGVMGLRRGFDDLRREVSGVNRALDRRGRSLADLHDTIIGQRIRQSRIDEQPTQYIKAAYHEPGRAKRLEVNEVVYFTQGEVRELQDLGHVFL